MELSGACKIIKNNPDLLKVISLYEGKSFEEEICALINLAQINLFSIYSLNEQLYRYANLPDTLLQQYKISVEDNKIIINCLVIPDEMTTITILLGS